METKLYITKSTDFSKRPTRRLLYSHFFADYQANMIQIAGAMIPKKTSDAKADFKRFFGSDNQLLLTGGTKQMLTNVTAEYHGISKSIEDKKYWILSTYLYFEENIVESDK